LGSGAPIDIDIRCEGEVSRSVMESALLVGFWGGVKDLASIKVEFNLRGRPIPDGKC
jgi:hypothetical protein